MQHRSARVARLTTSLVLSSLGLLTATGCDDGSDELGTLVVTVYGEPFIEEGIPADETVDGWAIEFQRFEVEISDVEADGESVSPNMSGPWELAMPTDGEGQVVGMVELPVGKVEHLDYRLGELRVEGTATRGGDVVTFDWTFATPTRYVDCQTEQRISKDTGATSQITIHADHLFYDDLVSETPNVAFDLIADADADADGIVAEAELAAVDITGEDRYQVGDAGITDLWSFIEAQSTTVGHIDGEGHCEIER